jgi:hypothetical protein
MRPDRWPHATPLLTSGAEGHIACAARRQQGPQGPHLRPNRTPTQTPPPSGKDQQAAVTFQGGNSLREVKAHEAKNDCPQTGGLPANLVSHGKKGSQVSQSRDKTPPKPEPPYGVNGDRTATKAARQTTASRRGPAERPPFHPTSRAPPSRTCPRRPHADLTSLSSTKWPTTPWPHARRNQHIPTG